MHAGSVFTDAIEGDGFVGKAERLAEGLAEGRSNCLAADSEPSVERGARVDLPRFRLVTRSAVVMPAAWLAGRVSSSSMIEGAPP